jgi:hypothetical protein
MRKDFLKRAARVGFSASSGESGKCGKRADDNIDNSLRGVAESGASFRLSKTRKIKVQTQRE